MTYYPPSDIKPNVAEQEQAGGPDVRIRRSASRIHDATRRIYNSRVDISGGSPNVFKVRPDHKIVRTSPANIESRNDLKTTYNAYFMGKISKNIIASLE